MICTVLASVSHAEVFLIVSMMLAGHEGSEFIARDAVFATVVIILNGQIGLCIFIDGRQHCEMGFRSDIATPFPSVLATLVTFTLVMQIVTTRTSGPDFTPSQFAFPDITSFLLHSIMASYFLNLSRIATNTCLKHKINSLTKISMLKSRVIPRP